jgi:hypothetical protein
MDTTGTLVFRLPRKAAEAAAPSLPSSECEDDEETDESAFEQTRRTMLSSSEDESDEEEDASWDAPADGTAAADVCYDEEEYSESEEDRRCTTKARRRSARLIRVYVYRCQFPVALGPCRRLFYRREQVIEHHASAHQGCAGAAEPAWESFADEPDEPDRFRCAHPAASTAIGPRTLSGRCGHEFHKPGAIRSHLKKVHDVEQKNLAHFVHVVEGVSRKHPLRTRRYVRAAAPATMQPTMPETVAPSIAGHKHAREKPASTEAETAQTAAAEAPAVPADERTSKRSRQMAPSSAGQLAVADSPAAAVSTAAENIHTLCAAAFAPQSNARSANSLAESDSDEQMAPACERPPIAMSTSAAKACGSTGPPHANKEDNQAADVMPSPRVPPLPHSLPAATSAGVASPATVDPQQLVKEAQRLKDEADKSHAVANAARAHKMAVKAAYAAAKAEARHATDAADAAQRAATEAKQRAAAALDAELERSQRALTQTAIDAAQARVDWEQRYQIAQREVAAANALKDEAVAKAADVERAKECMNRLKAQRDAL